MWIRIILSADVSLKNNNKTSCMQKKVSLNS